ncbi:MAG: fibronectin type III domain-containing protein, partial [Elusimicrobia bacterium]|nr:fibronectin type III domain-containing protein [Elusimicrobiota bacterium]
GLVSSYLLEAATASAFSSIAASSRAASGATSGLLTGLSENTIYFIRIVSINSAGSQNPSITITTLTTAGANFNDNQETRISLEEAKEEKFNASGHQPEKPTRTTIIGASTSTLTITWKEKNTGSLTYRAIAYRNRDDPSDSMAAQILVTDENSQENKIATATITGLKPNTSYFVSIAAQFTEAASSDYSSPDSDATLANPPKDLMIYFMGGNAYTLIWDNNDNPPHTSYEITHSLNNFQTNFSTAIGFPARYQNTRASLTGLVPGLAYFIRVRAVNLNNITTAFSDSYALIAAVPPGTSSGTTASNESSRIATADDSTALSFEANTFNSDTLVFISTDPLNHPMTANQDAIETAIERLAGYDFLPDLIREFNAISNNEYVDGNFDQNVRMEISYGSYDLDHDGLLDGTNPPRRVDTLSIWMLDESRLAFAPCPDSHVNAITQVVACTISHFSVYAVLSSLAPATGTADVYAYPVPWRPNGNDLSLNSAAITFANIPSAGTIEIISINGERLRTLGLSGPTTLTWDGTNDQGDRLSSGVYLWRVKNDAGSKTGKLIIIR